ncbi:hypothetical protein [Orenia marismortui]|uniref:DUF3899 domain-containing protein n=1 Tax=Orenia marismortui TaxID=46469 RepID=A0A4R8H9L9_9FIRM|nr:hypothetical protein [Orenia marismortui]TDX52308.1 hypothetical protein C7959_10715 [Orenia marismortui]
MKQRVKKLLKTGFIFIVLTLIVLVFISIIKNETLTLQWISNILFSQFLVLLALSSFLIIKEEFLSKIKEANKDKDNERNQDNSSKLNSGIELLIIALPILLSSIIITFL